ncbi:hypothetical protein [Bernardetia sp.]|uniref:hypothetical protein n=1 Tax=Bernardetia sp. TaxID=1937974 RepID=UPI0025BA3EE3|nr:hypothetical protein [Bernardetia sp.]
MTFIFWLLFFGISFLSILTSIFCKTGQTIQLLLVPSLFFSIYFVIQSFGKHQRNVSFSKTRELLFLVSGSVLIWLLNASFVFDISAIFNAEQSFKFLIPSKDSFFYGRLSEKLLTSSYETIFLFHEDFPSVLGTTPYHYFEFWLSAFFVKVFSVSGYVAYSLFTLPLLQICAWIGILAIFEQVRRQKLSSTIFLWSFALLFVGGIYLPFYNELKGFQSTYWLANTIFTGLSEHYFFWIAIFLAYQNKNYKTSVWIIFMLPIASPTLWAACWGGVFFIGIFLWVKEKSSFLKTNSLEILAFFLLPVCYFLFYYFTKSSENVADASTTVFAFLKSGRSILEVFKEVILYLFSFLVIYFPFLLLLYTGFKKNNRTTILLVFLLGGLLGGVVLYFLLPLHQERFQFLRNFILPFVQVSLIYLIINLKNILNYKVKGIFIILLCYGFGFTLHWFWKETQPHQVYSSAYLDVLEKELIENNKLKRGSIFHSDSYYDDKKLFNRNENFEIEGRYLAFKKDLERFYNLDMACLIENEKVTVNHFINTDIFAKWLIKRNQECSDSLKWLFVEEQQLDFVIIGKDVVIPNNIQSKTAFQAKDSKSGEIFLKLK